MQKQVKIMCAAVVLLAVAGSGLYHYHGEQTANSFELANIEALMNPLNDDTEEEEFEECSRILSSAACYHIVTGNFCHLRITAVEKYKRSSLVVNCDHYQVTGCSGNCREKKS